MTADRAKILDKLRKLKAHSESAASLKSEAEAASFAEMVQAMIVKHNIGQAELDKFDLEEELSANPIKSIAVPYDKVKIRKQRKAWLENLAAYVAHAHFCELLVNPTNTLVWFVGREAQANMAIDVYAKLVATAERLAKAEYFKHYHEVRGDSAYASIAGFKPAYLQAFTDRLGTRYRRKMEQIEDDINAAAGAMVLFKSEEQKLKEFIHDMFAHKKKEVKKIASIFDYTKVKPTLLLKWQRGFRWGLIQIQGQILFGLFETELDALDAMRDDSTVEPAKEARYHQEGNRRGVAAADRLDLGANPPSKRTGLLNG